MKRILTILAATLYCGSASADWVQWVGNGHYYQAFHAPVGINWADAQAQAEGYGGYLATVTSSAENAFVHSLVAADAGFWVNVGSGTRGPWLGGLQAPGSAEPGAGWGWVTGEPFSFQFWATFEPNNNNPDENRIHYYGLGGNNNFDATWNDINQNELLLGYIVEVVPEPSSITLCGMALAVYAIRRRRK